MKNQKFKNWYKRTWGNDNKGTDEFKALFAWNACKNEILKIINNDANWEYIDNERETLKEEALDELRNL